MLSLLGKKKNLNDLISVAAFPYWGYKRFTKVKHY